MKGFTSYLVARLGTSLVTLFGVAVAVFLLVRLLPGDPARVIAGLLATPDEVERIRHQLGFDRPETVQFAIFLGHLAVGDLGVSARTSEPVARELASRLPYTIELALAATVVGSLAGILAGVASATRRRTFWDYVLSLGSLGGISMPVYWSGVLLMIVFAVDLRWFPAAGASQPTSIVLPGVTLAFFSMAFVTRMTRASMLDVLRQDFVRTAYAKGLDGRRVVFRHALQNAFIPIVTVIGLQFGNLLGGAVLTETVFAWPGLGQLLVQSIEARDYPMVQGIILVYATMVIVVNFAVDMLYAYIDPRVRYT
ncbi:MAG: ABC transporter permease [Clostridia bacterium]|nr:ABC transporter permease [Clostridia bacterium]